MKKLLLSLGALSAVVAPVAAVVACGSKTETPAKHDINLTTEATSTLTKADLAKVTVEAGDTAASLQTKLELNQTPMSASGATFAWDAEALTLTTTSEVEGIKTVQVITVTPKAPSVVSVELGNNVITFHASGFEISTSWSTKLGNQESRNGLFSKIDLSSDSATVAQKKAFLDANFPKAPVNGVEEKADLSFWTDELVSSYKFTAKAVTNVFTVDDTKAPASWVLGDAAKTLAHHTDLVWKKQGATDEQLAAFKDFVAKKTSKDVA